MMKEQVFAQALLMAGQLEAQEKELLRALCNAWTTSLLSRLREDISVETCREALVTAASLYALADLHTADTGFVEEFKAGDLTLRQGSGTCGRENLQRQAGLLIGPYLKDSFAFMGV